MLIRCCSCLVIDREIEVEKMRIKRRHFLSHTQKNSLDREVRLVVVCGKWKTKNRKIKIQSVKIPNQNQNVKSQNLHLLIQKWHSHSTAISSAKKTNHVNVQWSVLFVGGHHAHNTTICKSSWCYFNSQRIFRSLYLLYVLYFLWMIYHHLWFASIEFRVSFSGFRNRIEPMRTQNTDLILKIVRKVIETKKQEPNRTVLVIGESAIIPAPPAKWLCVYGNQRVGWFY